MGEQAPVLPPQGAPELVSREKAGGENAASSICGGYYRIKHPGNHLSTVLESRLVGSAHCILPTLSGASLVAQLVESTAMRETWVRSLGQEDPLEKGMATHSSLLAWRIPWTEEPGGLQSMGLHRVRRNWSD